MTDQGVTRGWRSTGLLEYFREILKGNLRSRRDDDRPFQHVLQLTNIAGPAVPQQRVSRRRVDALNGTFVLAGKLGQKMIAEQRNVLRAIAQRWNLERNRIDAKV